MRYRLLFVLVLSGLLCLPAAAQEEAEQQDELLQAVRSLSNALSDANDDEEAVKRLSDFLEKYPDTKYTAPVLDAAAYYLSEKMSDHDWAIEFVQGHLPKITDQENLKSSKVVLAGLYNVPALRDELRWQVADLEQYGRLSVRQYGVLGKAAFGAEDWDLVFELCGPALEAASPEAMREAYPDAPEETIEERSEEAIVNIEIQRSWALANTGKLDQAIKIFESAKDRVDYNYFGAPDNGLYVYWGKALMMKGDDDAALQKLLPVALWNEDKEAMEAVEKIHGANGGSEEQFEEYINEKRLEHARQIETFSAADYDGKQHKSKKLMGKATLVAFWFPT